jgi:hypothetical protein
VKPLAIPIIISNKTGLKRKALDPNELNKFHKRKTGATRFRDEQVLLIDVAMAKLTPASAPTMQGDKGNKTLEVKKSSSFSFAAAATSSYPFSFLLLGQYISWVDNGAGRTQVGQDWGAGMVAIEERVLERR